jgi:hypothetical protein
MRPMTTIRAERDVRGLSLFADACDRLNGRELAEAYRSEGVDAPRRWDVGKLYLTATRTGTPGTGGFTNRNEEHLAIAIFNAHRPPTDGVRLPDSRKLQILDYQMPLKARQTDAAVGKVDLLGRLSTGEACIIELKAAGSRDTPLKAMIEALGYAAIVEANLDCISQEVQALFKLPLIQTRPMVAVAGPTEYWRTFRVNRASRHWELAISQLTERVKDHVGIQVLFLDLGIAGFIQGLNGASPQLQDSLACRWAVPSAVR